MEAAKEQKVNDLKLLRRLPPVSEEAEQGDLEGGGRHSSEPDHWNSAGQKEIPMYEQERGKRSGRMVIREFISNQEKKNISGMLQTKILFESSSVLSDEA